MGAAPLVAVSPFRLTVTSGSLQGTHFDLLANGASIGRGPQNDIVIASDERMSRVHARIQLTPQGIEVRDLSGKSKIELNGQLLETALVFPGTSFKLGTTVFRVDLVNAPTVPGTRPTPLAPPRAAFPAPPVAPMGLPPLPSGPPTRPRTVTTAPVEPVNRRLIFYGVVALLGAGGYFFLSPTAKRMDPPPLGGSPTETTDRIQDIAKEVDRKILLSEKEGHRNPNWREAQSLYLQGFRDYKKGQYGRAIESFRGALSVYPAHQQANRYLQQTRRKLEEITQKQMQKAREYRERNMFQKCAANFALAMSVIHDPNSSLYKEAKVGRDDCQVRVEGRY